MTIPDILETLSIDPAILNTFLRIHVGALGGTFLWMFMRKASHDTLQNLHKHETKPGKFFQWIEELFNGYT